jgi:hypothetical protein
MKYEVFQPQISFNSEPTARAFEGPYCGSHGITENMCWTFSAVLGSWSPTVILSCIEVDRAVVTGGDG